MKPDSGEGGKEISGMEAFYLSRRGRVTLIKSTLSTLPTYFLSLLLWLWQTVLQNFSEISFKVV